MHGPINLRFVNGFKVCRGKDTFTVGRNANSMDSVTEANSPVEYCRAGSRVKMWRLTVTETSEKLHVLIRMSAREHSIEICHRESFKTYKLRVVDPVKYPSYYYHYLNRTLCWAISIQFTSTVGNFSFNASTTRPPDTPKRSNLTCILFCNQLWSVRRAKHFRCVRLVVSPVGFPRNVATSDLLRSTLLYSTMLNWSHLFHVRTREQASMKCNSFV